MTDPAIIDEMLRRWRDDAGGAHQTWFLWAERIKNFRSIRRGLQLVVAEIESDRFGNAYRGSSLETVVHSIAEQRPMFRGADHAFLWKPKLRIPDIYEHRENQLAFGHFLKTCACCDTESAILAAIRSLDRQCIKGLGPAAANLLYFLHPTLAPPFNTAIVEGYNALTGARVKLGSWEHYVALRQGMVRLTEQHRRLLSNDLGAIAAFLFDVGSRRYPAPPRLEDPVAVAAWKAELQAVRVVSAQERRTLDAARDQDRTHTEVQGWLRDLGHGLGFDVWIAANDRSRPHGAGALGDRCLLALPEPLASAPGSDAVKLIDVLWLERGTATVAAAFEVEHTTSIYSGIIRLLDLALGAAESTVHGLFLVAPDAREGEVRAQLLRPAFQSIAGLHVRYLAYGDLDRNREAMARFGQGLRPLDAIARTL